MSIFHPRKFSQESKSVSSKPRKRLKMKLRNTGKSVIDNSRSLKPRYIFLIYWLDLVLQVCSKSSLNASAAVTIQINCNLINQVMKIFSSLFLFQHMGSREGVAAKIDADTVIKIEDMNRAISMNKNAIIGDVIGLVYNIKPEVHKNYLLKLNMKN